MPSRDRMKAAAVHWSLVSAALLLVSLPAGAQQRRSECAACHVRLEDEDLSAPAVLAEADVHGSAGVACTACHGGDAAAVRESVAHQGMLADPPRSRTPELCGRCHSNLVFMRRYNPDIRVDQVDAYLTSRHGQRLVEERDESVATCVDCHTSHSVFPPSEEKSSVHPVNVPDLCGTCHADTDHMAPYDIPTDQLTKYQASVHWQAVTEAGDLSAPVCNDCHGNHGAVPPGYQSVGRVCAECHVQIGDYFAQSPHDSVFVRLGKPGCATCHSNHEILQADDELLGLGDEATCRDSGCHSADDEGGRVAQAMLSLIDSLRTDFEKADSILVEAEVAGMPVSQAQFELSMVRNAIVGARAIMHTSQIDSVRTKIDEGKRVAADGYATGVAAFEELDVRRLGLAVSSLVILLLIWGLLRKIKQLEQ